MFFNSKFYNFFRKMESSQDSDSDCCIKMYKEGDDIEQSGKHKLNFAKL